MKTGLQPIDWATAGALLANADDNDQTAFFKAMCKEFKTWPTRHQAEMQLAYVNAKLTDEEKECLSMLGYKSPTP